MPDKLTQESLENVSGLSPGSCLQATAFGRLFPDGLDLEDKQSSQAWQQARDAGLDATFAACHVAESLVGLEILAEFRDFCLQQLRDLLPSEPSQVLSDTRPNTPPHKAATRHQKLVGAPITATVAYGAAVSARLAARALGDGRASVRVDQAAWWQRKHDRLLGDK